MKKILKSLKYIVMGGFVVYTVYLLLMMYVFHVISPHSSHTVHSANIAESKQKGLFVASYRFDRFLTDKMLADALIPKEIFMERESIHYEYYYFYWGKTMEGKTFSVDASGFKKLSATGTYLYCSPSGMEGCDGGMRTLDEYNKNLYFAVGSAPDSFLVSIYKPGDFNNPFITLYKKK